MRPGQKFGQHDSGLRIAVVVGLQAGEDDVKALILDRSGESPGGVRGVEGCKGIVFQMDGAIGALGQAFAQHLLRARRAGGDYNDFPSMFLFLPQGLFEGVRVRLIDLVRNIFPNPGASLVELERRIFLRHLLHADQDVQDKPPGFGKHSQIMRKSVSINEGSEK